MGALGRSATEARERKGTEKVEGREKVRKKDGRGGRIDWNLRANAQRRRAPLTIFWLDWQSGSHRQGVLGKRKIPGRKLTQSTPFLKRAKI